MIVCLCEGISCRVIRREIQEGSRSVSDLARRTGAGSQCGSCRVTLRALLDASEPAGTVACAPRPA